MEFLRPHFGPREIGVSDLIAQEVGRHHRDNVKIMAIFEGRVSVLPFLPISPEAAEWQELIVCPFSFAESAGAGSRDGTVVVYQIARFPWPRREHMLPGDPGLTTLTGCLRDHMLSESVARLPMETPMGTVRLATRVEPDAVNYMLEGNPSAAGYAVVMPYRYQVDLWIEPGPLYGKPRVLVESGYYE